VKFLICSCFFQLREKLTGVLNDSKASLDVLAFTAISLGLIFVGSCNEEIAQAIIYTLMDRSESELGEPLTRLLPLGLGLLYLGKQVISCLAVCCLYLLSGFCYWVRSKLLRYNTHSSLVLCILQDSVEATAEVSKTFNEKIRKYCDMTLLSCAYAGTGNVLKVQSYDEVFKKRNFCCTFICL